VKDGLFSTTVKEGILDASKEKEREMQCLLLEQQVNAIVK